jgi:hypothetical protein
VERLEIDKLNLDTSRKKQQAQIGYLRWKFRNLNSSLIGKTTRPTSTPRPMPSEQNKQCSVSESEVVAVSQSCTPLISDVGTSEDCSTASDDSETRSVETRDSLSISVKPDTDSL